MTNPGSLEQFIEVDGKRDHPCILTLLSVTTFSTFASENSALGAKLIVAARSQR
jgi:hypothetical protein